MNDARRQARDYSGWERKIGALRFGCERVERGLGVGDQAAGVLQRSVDAVTMGRVDAWAAVLGVR
jgi:hypothetical protein